MKKDLRSSKIMQLKTNENQTAQNRKYIIVIAVTIRISNGSIWELGDLYVREGNRGMVIALILMK
jgi:hypothetical protein